MGRPSRGFPAILTLLLFLSLTSCCTLFPKPCIRKEADFYRANYGSFYQRKDTAFIQKDRIFMYEKGLLVQTGKFKGDKRHGLWLSFEDSLKLKNAVRYRGNRADTLLRADRIKR